jgi:hypothetical protein
MNDQHKHLVNDAAASAYSALKTFCRLTSYLSKVGFSPAAAAASTDPVFLSFVQGVQAVVTEVQANNGAIMLAFGAMAAYAPAQLPGKPQPTQGNVVTQAPQVASDGASTLSDLEEYLTEVAAFASVAAGLLTVDWSGATGPVPGYLVGFNPVFFTAYNTAVASLLTLLSAAPVSPAMVTIGEAFSAMAETVTGNTG